MRLLSHEQEGNLYVRGMRGPVTVADACTLVLATERLCDMQCSTAT